MLDDMQSEWVKMSTAEELKRLLSELPPPGEALASDDADVQSKALLALLVEGAGQAQFSAMQGVPADPSTCPNCGQPATSLRSPYCGDACREESAFVRQFRQSLMTGKALEPERQVALGEKVWHVLGGGYPRRQSLAPNSALKQVFKREDGRCELCGAPATTIDHTGSG